MDRYEYVHVINQYSRTVYIFHDCIEIIPQPILYYLIYNYTMRKLGCHIAVKYIEFSFSQI